MFTPRPQNRWAWDIPQRAINLPTYHDMTADQLERVSNVIKALAHG
jgi:perosamine synthetase